MSSKNVVQNIDIVCRRINGNISSFETDLVELMSRNIVSIEERLNEWTSKELSINLRISGRMIWENR